MGVSPPALAPLTAPTPTARSSGSWQAGGYLTPLYISSSWKHRKCLATSWQLKKYTTDLMNERMEADIGALAMAVPHRCPRSHTGTLRGRESCMWLPCLMVPKQLWSFRSG